MSSSVICPECIRAFSPLGKWQRICRDCYREEKRTELAELRIENERLRNLVQLPEPPFLRKLIMLSHPDRHGNSQLSNNVTRELLALRERINT